MLVGVSVQRANEKIAELKFIGDRSGILGTIITP